MGRIASDTLKCRLSDDLSDDLMGVVLEENHRVRTLVTASDDYSANSPSRARAGEGFAQTPSRAVTGGTAGTSPLDHDAAEAAAMAAHYAQPADPNAWKPGDPDPYAEGLLQSWRAHR